jgi:hypothetical protein
MPDTNESALEKTFSDLAFATLRDKAPALVDYLLGFQMVKQEEEGSRAIGLFGYEIDTKVLYTPVFFLNGEIRGLDSIYSVDSDLFFPLTEGWVNTIINKQAVSIGQPDTRDRNERGIAVPNYLRMKTIPSSHGGVNLKLSSDVTESMQKVAESVEGAIDLPTALAQTGLTGMFKEALEKHPKLLDAFNQFYSYADLYSEVKTAAPKTKPVVVITAVTDEGVDELTDDQKTTVVAGGVAVIDKRPETSKSIVYATETHKRLENPTAGNVYDVLWSDGSVEAAIIVPTDELGQVAVVRLSDRKHCIVQASDVFTTRQYSRTEFEKALKDLGKSPSDVLPNETVLLVSDHGQCGGAYCVKNKVKGLDKTTVLEVLDEYYMNADPGYDRGTFNLANRRAHSGTYGVPICCGAGGVKTILVPQIGGTEPRFANEKLIVNDKHFYAIKLNGFSTETSEHCDTHLEENYSKDRIEVLLKASDFGDDMTLVESLKKTAQEVRIWRNDHLVTIHDQYGTHALHKKAAYEHCLTKHGMAESDVRVLLDNAEAVVESFYVKYAAEFVDMPEAGMDDTYGNEMTQYHRGQVPLGITAKRTPEDNREFYMYNSPFGDGGTDDQGQGQGSPLDRITEAAQTGQKEVFDSAALGSLIKSHNPTDLVERFMPTITSGMDRLGRLLFLVYWHYEDFEERYGESELSEFMDNLKSVFNDLGDVVIFAKKRSLAGDPNFYGVGVQGPKANA